MTTSFAQFADQWQDNARLALDTLAMKPTVGIASWVMHVMDMPFVENYVGRPGQYRGDPHGVYLEFQRRVGACMIDQYLAENSLTMGPQGFEGNTSRGATTGAGQIVRDGIVIDSAEAVAEHLERVEFPRMAAQIAALGAQGDEVKRKLIARECELQTLFGVNLLKVPYVFKLPGLRYGQYGYEHYLTAYALFPELMAKDFALQADRAQRYNAIVAAAIVEGRLPRCIRLDHDMTDSRGTLVSLGSLESIWFPQLARCIKPLLDAGVRLIWHCDGNIMPMVGGLLEAGIGGFQGFQYEDGVDYVSICKMKSRAGEPLLIWGGVSVTRTLPFGSPSDVRKEMRWLVENGPAVGLFLGGSSSITPGVPHENLLAMIEGLGYYRKHGRQGL